MLIHPITAQSFAIIDSEIGAHGFLAAEYAILRRVIHATADFEYRQLIHFDHNPITKAMAALKAGVPIITDVSMVAMGIQNLLQQTSKNPLIIALDYAEKENPTRSAHGMQICRDRFPQGIFVIGNAPTALLSLCENPPSSFQPALIVGAPVGFVAVQEAKTLLRQTNYPQIRIDGRKGGSGVAAAIINALLILLVQDCEK